MAGIEMFWTGGSSGSRVLHTALHSGPGTRDNTHLKSPTVVPYMAGELVEGPRSLILLLPSFFSESRKRSSTGGGWKGRCGRGNDWLRMEEGIRERKGSRGRYLLRSEEDGEEEKGVEENAEIG